MQNYPVETIYEWLDKGAEIIARDLQIPYIEGLAEAGEAFFTGSGPRAFRKSRTKGEGSARPCAFFRMQP